MTGPRSVRQLLDAVMTVGWDLDLEAVLRHIVESAVSLVDALHAATGDGSVPVMEWQVRATATP